MSFYFGLVIGAGAAWLITWLSLRSSFRTQDMRNEQRFEENQLRAQAHAWQEGFDAARASVPVEFQGAGQAGAGQAGAGQAGAAQVGAVQTGPGLAGPDQARPVQAGSGIESDTQSESAAGWVVPGMPISPTQLPVGRESMAATAPQVPTQVPQPQVSGAGEAAGVVVPHMGFGGPSAPILSEAELAERRNLRNINLTLATAGLLLLGACAAFLATGFAGGLKVAAVGLVMVLFYAGGLFVHARFPKLRAAGMALAGIGLGLVPFFGLALNLVGNLSPAWCWFVASVLGLAGSTIAVWLTRSQVLVFVGMALVLSTLWSVNAVIDLPVLWYYVSAVIFALLVTAVGLIAPGWVPRMLTSSAQAIYRYLLPAVLVAAGLSFTLLSVRGYLVLAVLIALAYGLQLFVARGTDRVIAYFGVRFAVTVGVILAAVELRESFGWPSSLWIAVLAAVVVLGQFFAVRYGRGALVKWIYPGSAGVLDAPGSGDPGLGARIRSGDASGSASGSAYATDLLITFALGVIPVFVIQGLALGVSAQVMGLAEWIAVLACWLLLSAATAALMKSPPVWRGRESSAIALVLVPLIPAVLGIVANFEWDPRGYLLSAEPAGNFAPFVALVLNAYMAGRLGWLLWRARGADKAAGGQSGGEAAGTNGAGASVSAQGTLGRSRTVIVVALKLALLGLPVTFNGVLTRGAEETVAWRAANWEYAAWGVALVAAVLLAVDMVALLRRRNSALFDVARPDAAHLDPSGIDPSAPNSAHVVAVRRVSLQLGAEWLIGFAALMTALHRGMSYIVEVGFSLAGGPGIAWLLVGWFALGAVASAIAVVRQLPWLGIASVLGPLVSVVSAVGIISFEQSLPGLRVAAVLSVVITAGVVIWVTRIGARAGAAADAAAVAGARAGANTRITARILTIRDSYLIQCEISIVGALLVLFADSDVPFYTVSVVLLGVLVILLAGSTLLRGLAGNTAIMRANRLVLFILIAAFPLGYAAVSFAGSRNFSADTEGIPSALVILLSGLAAAVAALVMVRAQRAAASQASAASQATAVTNQSSAVTNQTSAVTGPASAVTSPTSTGWHTYWPLLALAYGWVLIALSVTRSELLSEVPVRLGVLNPGWTSILMGLTALALVIALAQRMRRGSTTIPVSLVLVGAAALGVGALILATMDETPQFFFAVWFLMVAVAAVRLGYALGRGLAFLTAAHMALVLAAIFMSFHARSEFAEPWPSAVITTLLFVAIVAVFAGLWLFDQKRANTGLLHRNNGDRSEPTNQRHQSAQGNQSTPWTHRYPDRLLFLAIPTVALFIATGITVMREQGYAFIRLGTETYPGIDTPANLAWVGAIGVLAALAIACAAVPQQWRITAIEVSAIIAVWPAAVIVQATAPGLLTEFWLSQIWLLVIAAIGCWEAFRSRYLLGTIILAVVGIGLVLSQLTLEDGTTVERGWGTFAAIALLGVGIVLRRRDISGLLVLGAGTAATVAAAQKLYLSITGASLEFFWQAQWWIIAVAILSLAEFFRGKRQWGKIGFAAAAGALLVSEASTIFFPATDRQIYALIAMAAVLAVGVLSKSPLFTWMGVAGVAGAVVWFLRGYTFVLLGLLALALLTLAVLRLRKVSLKNETTKDGEDQDTLKS